MERAVALGDGWSPFLSSPVNSESNRATGMQSLDQLARQVDEAQRLRSETTHGGGFDIVLESWGQLLPSNRSAPERRRFLDLVSRLGDAGVTWLCILPPHESKASYLDALNWYSQEIFPVAQDL
jgi:hypothetical protein